MIILNNVTKYYPVRGGRRCILDNITFTLNKGERLGILGCNGAGKSTLVRIISGAEHPSSGTIERRMSLSWPLAFRGGFSGALTGLDNLRFICRVYDVDYDKALPIVEDFSELGPYLREPVARYSSGMMAKLGFGISMAVDFDCYLIDEITAVGDKKFRIKCKQEFFDRRQDRSIIMVSHSLAVIKLYCNIFSILHQGRLTIFDNYGEAVRCYDRLMSTGSLFPAAG